jgi:hypothetical protein
MYQATNPLMRHRINRRICHRTSPPKARLTNPRVYQVIDPPMHQSTRQLLLPVSYQVVYRAINLLHPASDQVGCPSTHLPVHQAIRQFQLPVNYQVIHRAINLLHPAFNQVGRHPVHLPSCRANRRATIRKSLIFRPLHQCRGKIRKTTQPGTWGLDTSRYMHLLVTQAEDVNLRSRLRENAGGYLEH